MDEDNQEKLTWDQVVTLGTQKGANGAIVFVSIKLIYGADLTTGMGVIVTSIGASLLAIAATIEYLTWRTRIHVVAASIKDIQKLTKDSFAALVSVANAKLGSG